MLNRFSSNIRKTNKIIPIKASLKTLADTDLTGSLQNIEAPTTNKFNSKVKLNTNPNKLINNKNTISEFHTEILQHSARYIGRNISEFDDVNNKLIIYNVRTDYGTEGASPDNFEILVYGLHIPGNYTITENGNNVIITLNDRYIDFNNVTISDIYVIGKLVDIVLDTEDFIDLRTENDENIII